MYPDVQHTDTICDQLRNISATTRQLLLGLSNVCERLRATTCDPLLDQIVLHRSQCRKLASSYRLALQLVEARILQRDHDEIYGRFPDSLVQLDAKEVLDLSLRAMLQAMQRGERFIQDCSSAGGHTWLLKAVGGLALSTEAVHTHLHDLMWCIYIVTMAVERIMADQASLDGSMSMIRCHESLQDLPGWQCGSTIEEAIVEIWENKDIDDDLKSVLQVLSKLRADRNIDGNHARIADFLWKRLSDHMMHYNKFSHLDPNGLRESLWIDVAASGLRQHIHDVVGEGAFAKVSKVEWLGGEFAMKDFFHVDIVQFGKEAAIQAQLQHPNVLHLICCASGPNRCSLLMELMQEDLLSFMNKRTAAGKDPPFSLLEAVDIMLQISKGMEYLHSLNVLHRDLKSNNILVGTGHSLNLDEDTRHVHVQVKVADFGMAKSKQRSSMTSSSEVQRGATRWRAPEVFLNEPEDDDDDNDGVVPKLPKRGNYTKKADVYSFGMVCSEILTGKLPFEKSRLMGLYRRLMAGERPTLPDTCPSALASLIKRCWHGNPLQRPLFPQISRILLYFKANLVLTNQKDVTISRSPAFLPTIQAVVDMPSLGKTCAAAAYYKNSSLHIVKEMYQCRLEDLLQFQRSAQTGVPAHEEAQSRPMATNMQTVVEESNEDLLQFQRSAQTGVPAQEETQSRPMATNMQTVMEESNLTAHVNYSADESSESPVAPSVQKKSAFGFLGRFFCWSCGAAHRPGTDVESFLQQAREFSYTELQNATNSFSRPIGQGAFAKVYWGKLPNGQEVAVKRLIQVSQGQSEFMRELKILGSLRHRNLVPLLGWCTEEGSFLVYEFMPNDDLNTHLRVRYSYELSDDHDQPIMAWGKRYQIVCQLASALHYLHHDSGYSTIVHRDVKPSNVFLDSNWNARLGDCGLSFILPRHEASRRGRVAGTLGFLDPYAITTGRFGAWSDVYAFGVTALVVASGEPVFKKLDRTEGWSSGPFLLRDWVYELYHKGELLAAGDTRLRQCFDELQMRRLLVVGLACTVSAPVQRPTMQLVLDVLKGTSSYDLLKPQGILKNRNIGS